MIAYVTVRHMFILNGEEYEPFNSYVIEDDFTTFGASGDFDMTIKTGTADNPGHTIFHGTYIGHIYVSKLNTGGAKFSVSTADFITVNDKNGIVFEFMGYNCWFYSDFEEELTCDYTPANTATKADLSYYNDSGDRVLYVKNVRHLRVKKEIFGDVLYADGDPNASNGTVEPLVTGNITMGGTTYVEYSCDYIEVKINPNAGIRNITVNPEVILDESLVNDATYRRTELINKLQSKSYTVADNETVIKYPFYFVSNIDGTICYIKAFNEDNTNEGYPISIENNEVNIDISNLDKTGEQFIKLQVLISRM